MTKRVLQLSPFFCFFIVIFIVIFIVKWKTAKWQTTKKPNIKMLGLLKYWAYKIARFKLFANGGDEETWILYFQ